MSGPPFPTTEKGMHDCINWMVARLIMAPSNGIIKQTITDFLRLEGYKIMPGESDIEGFMRSVNERLAERHGNRDGRDKGSKVSQGDGKEHTGSTRLEL